MSSAVSILTWNRLPALKTCLESFQTHLPLKTPLAVFEDAGEADDTRGYLRTKAKGLTTSLARAGDPKRLFSTQEIGDADRAFAAKGYSAIRSNGEVVPGGPGYETMRFSIIAETLFVLGTRNLGVAGNSNRALKWMMETDADHFLLCNDDVQAHGNFAEFYRQAHEDLGVGMFCFCDLPGAEYEPSLARVGEYTVKMLPRMTGIVLSLTRAVVDAIGYFDVRMGRFSEEHCKYTNRARLAGFLDLEGQRQLCLDVDCEGLLTSQPVPSSMPSGMLPTLQREGSAKLRQLSARYLYDGFHRPYRLHDVPVAGGLGGLGIKPEYLRAGYSEV